jgi:integrase/recombinase XerD
MSKNSRAPNGKPLSSSYKNQFIATLRGLLKYLKEEEKIDVYDYGLVKKFREENKPVEVLSDEDVKTLLNSIKENCVTKLRLKTLIVCLLSTGSRISAMMSINKEDINWENGVVSVIGKGRKINQMIFNELSREYLKKYLDKRNDNYPELFVTSKGTRWSVNCVERAIRNQGIRAGIKKRVHCHIFRATSASKMFFSGVPLSVVSRFLSHSNLATTQKFYLRGANFEEVQSYHNTLDYGNLMTDE